MRRIIVALVASCLIGDISLAQTSKDKNYIQNVPGTTVSFSMQAIPGGTFNLGNNKSKNNDEKPEVKVEIDPFWMGTHEVTWDLFELFLYKDYEQSKQTEGKVSPEVDAVTRPTKPYLDMTFGMGKQNMPALAMTQYNAIQFCKWLYVRTGVFYRLPTEAEWEYACKAGSTTEFFFGNDQSKLAEYAWYDVNSGKKTNPVGQKKPNAFGLYDILGNVAEWTYDQYKSDFYTTLSKQGKVVNNPVSEATDLYPHSVRGGAFNSTADKLRSTARTPSDPIWKQLDPQMPKSNWWFPEAPFIGLRLVRPAVTPSHDEIMAYYDKAPVEDYN